VWDVEDGCRRLDLFRLSSAAPGRYSLDIYDEDEGCSRFVFQRKAGKKYDASELPWPPPGAARADVEGVEVHTRVPMTDDEQQATRTRLRAVGKKKPRRTCTRGR
jgi:hypothetical protein